MHFLRSLPWYQSEHNFSITSLLFGFRYIDQKAMKRGLWKVFIFRSRMLSVTCQISQREIRSIQLRASYAFFYRAFCIWLVKFDRYNFETPWTVIRWLNENELIWNGRDVGKSHIVSCQFEIQAIVDWLKKSR